MGGPSVRIFGEHFRPKLPPQAQLFPEGNLDYFFGLLDLPMPRDPIEPELDLEFFETSFLECSSYSSEIISVQTKEGCPNSCFYCLYGYLKGKELRRRNPLDVVKEIRHYHRRWGSCKFWFVDSQLLSEPKDHEHLSIILEGLSWIIINKRIHI